MTPRTAKSMLLALSLCAPALAQTTEDDAAPRFYDVEIVVFKNLKVPRAREYVLPVRSPARDESMLDLGSSSSIEAAREQGYELLSPEQLRLGEIVAKLIDSDRYQVLVHTAWRQPGVPREEALPVWIRGGRVYGTEYNSIDSQVRVQQMQPPPVFPGSESAVAVEPVSAEIESAPAPPPIAPGELYELEGKISVGLGRYLHTYADLVLRRPRRGAETLPANTAGERSLAGNDAWILNNHHLKEHRRMRSRNLHYLDHPEFSLLVLIHAFDAEAAAASMAAETDDGIVLDSDLTPTEAAGTSQAQ